MVYELVRNNGMILRRFVCVIPVCGVEADLEKHWRFLYVIDVLVALNIYSVGQKKLFCLPFSVYRSLSPLPQAMKVLSKKRLMRQAGFPRKRVSRSRWAA